MDNDLQYTLSFFAIAYACLAFIKFMLCVPHIPRAIGVLSRLAGAERGRVMARYIFLIPMLVVGIALFGWVSAMYREGLSFFGIYRNYSVIHDCITAYRLAHADDTQE